MLGPQFTFRVAVFMGRRAMAALNRAYHAWLEASKYYNSVKNDHPSKYTHHLGQFTIYRREEFANCVDAIILYQSMMETIINYAYREHSEILGTMPKNQSFANKWRIALKKIVDEKDPILTTFDQYDKQFYKALRNPLVHPDAGVNQGTGKPTIAIKDTEPFRFAIVYRGMFAGWQCFEKLFDGIEMTHDEDSWATFCNTYGLPSSIDQSEFIPISDMLIPLEQRFQDLFN